MPVDRCPPDPRNVQLSYLRLPTTVTLGRSCLWKMGLESRCMHFTSPFLARPRSPTPSAWIPAFGKNTGPAILHALFKPPDSIALDNPSENSVAFPPTPPDSALIPILRLSWFKLHSLQQSATGDAHFPSHRTKANPFRSQLGAISTPSVDATVTSAQGIALPSTLCATQHDPLRRVAIPSHHSPWGN